MLIIITPGMLLLIGIILALYSLNEEDKDAIIIGFFRIVGWLLTRLAPPILLFIIGAVYHWPGSAAPLATLGWWVYLTVRRKRRERGPGWTSCPSRIYTIAFCGNSLGF
jgi:hypothetical protein